MEVYHKGSRMFNKSIAIFMLLCSTFGYLPTAAAGTPINATIAIPSLKIQSAILELPLTQNGWDTSNLGNRVGHLGETAWLGEPGNIVLGGHLEVNWRNSIFSKLPNIEIGARITLTDGNTVQEYQVVETRIVDVTDLSVVYFTPENRLTLLTCFNYNSAQKRYTQRFVAIAVPV